MNKVFIVNMKKRYSDKRSGLLIAFEGIDGTGKSTQIRMLAEALERDGYPVVSTREPTSGQYGQQIRELYSNRDTASPEKELDLFIADRREHVSELIAPSLAAGKIVLTDRYYFSTAAYQGAAGHDPHAILRQNEEFAPVPDLVILLVLPVAEGVQRIQTLRGETLNDFEQESELTKVSAVFDGLRRDCIKRVDAARSIEKVHEDVMRFVRQLL